MLILSIFLWIFCETWKWNRIESGVSWTELILNKTDKTVNWVFVLISFVWLFYFDDSKKSGNFKFLTQLSNFCELDDYPPFQRSFLSAVTQHLSLERKAQENFCRSNSSRASQKKVLISFIYRGHPLMISDFLGHFWPTYLPISDFSIV